MKKKDMEIDSPFESSCNPSEQITSLDVPKHKRWRCANYTHKIGADESSRGVRVEETNSPTTEVILSKQVVSGYSLQIPSKGKNNDHGTYGSGANILIQPSHASPSIEKVEHHLRNNNISLHINNDFDLRKFPEDRHASSHMHMVPGKNLQGGSLSKGEDIVQMLIGMGMITSQPESNLYFKQKLGQTLGCFMGAQKHVENDIIQTKSIPNWTLTILKDNNSCDPLKANGVESSQSFKKRVNPTIRQSILVQSDQSSRNGFINLNRNIDLNYRQEIHITPNSLQWENHQIQKLMVYLSDPKRKKRKAHALTQFDGRKLQQSASSSGLLCTTRDSDPNDNISKLLDVGGCSTPATVLPVSRIAKKDLPCLLNQNPADIADTDDERYFRTGEDQRIRDKSSLPEKSGVNVKLDGRQRQRHQDLGVYFERAIFERFSRFCPMKGAIADGEKARDNVYMKVMATMTHSRGQTRGGTRGRGRAIVPVGAKALAAKLVRERIGSSSPREVLEVVSQDVELATLQMVTSGKSFQELVDHTKNVDSEKQDFYAKSMKNKGKKGDGFSGQLKVHEKNYSTHYLKLAAVVFALRFEGIISMVSDGSSMETSVGKDCHDASDSKSLGSELRRTELSVDLSLPLPVIVNGRDCQQFSIRQYVAEMKKKDMTFCSPFGTSSNSSEQLSSLEVPELKRFWCANYSHKIGADGSVGNIVGLPSLGLRKGIDQTSKGGDANLAENSRCDLREDTANDPKRRKTPKVRLMAELLSGKGNLGRSSTKAELFSMNTISMELDTVVAPIDKGVRMVTSQPENELYLKEKLVQTLSSFTGAKKYVKNDTIQRNIIPYWPFTIPKGNKSCDPLKANGVEPIQPLQKGVIPTVRQPIVVQSDQYRRDGFINLNQTIDLNHRQEIHLSPNPLHRKNHQIQKLVLQETPHPSNKINLNEIQDNSYVTITKKNQRTMKVTERGPSTYVPPMDNMETFRNRHERSHPRAQNGVLSWINPESTNFNPFYANVGFLRGSSAMTQVKEQPIKHPNSVQVSSHVPAGWRLQNVARSNLIRFSIAQNTTFLPYNLDENHKREQVNLSSIQKGKTISDLKSVNSTRAEVMRTKGMRSLNSFSSEGMSATQLSRYQERHFTPQNIHSPFLMHENPSIYNGFFLPHHQLKESSDAYMSGFTEVQSSRQHVSYYKDQGVSLGSQEKKGKTHALEQLGRRKLQQSASSSDLLHTTRDSDPKVDLIQDDDISKKMDMRGYSTPATVLPVISIPKKDPPCLLNQNPADIIDADDERYFRTVEDQRIWYKSSLRGKSGVDVKLDGRQRQRRKERSGRMPVVGLKS
ncbi:uncharacterized protein LOC129890687 [Solanum dulcamara]|uniref:uncharacterized protein LOC129890687 n=1 Tax=Solanum dulcamara TaxID=45834 RepID=UPI00248673C4|nr:uncharacterized protein LOC129890687 [Solanum dulcamara]